LNVDKQFTRWLDKLVNAGLVTISSEIVLPAIPPEEMGGTALAQRIIPHFLFI